VVSARVRQAAEMLEDVGYHPVTLPLGAFALQLVREVFEELRGVLAPP